MWKINTKLVPIKAHYFFFMAAMGPILPYTIVFGKQLGISEVVMGSIAGILPLIFLLAKPAFGFIVDYFQSQRKTVFIILIAVMCGAHVLLYFVPATLSARSYSFSNVTCRAALPCSPMLGLEKIDTHSACDISHLPLNCTWTCSEDGSHLVSELMLLTSQPPFVPSVNHSSTFCTVTPQSAISSLCENNPDLYCKIDCVYEDPDENCLYKSLTFWSFVLLMATGSIAYNVANSISDAICFDVLGDGGEMGYGHQRVFGAIGFGLSALLAGYVIDLWSVGSRMKDYAPAFVLTLAFGLLDLLTCSKLKLPKISPSENILKDIRNLLKHPNIVVFLIFATFAGVCDSFIIYFMFWYLEDLAQVSGAMSHVKLIEGLVIAAETLGGEVIFFSFAGKILERLGYETCLSLSFGFYALRLGLISLAPNPWWLLPTEFFLQGPSYALCYTTIVAYASAVAPPGTSATMQGLVAGMDDGFGYTVGSLSGGLLYHWLGGSISFRVFSGLALLCSASHIVIHKWCLKRPTKPSQDASYREVPQAVFENKTPKDASNELV